MKEIKIKIVRENKGKNTNAETKLMKSNHGFISGL